MFYSVREYRGRKGEPKGIGWRDLRDLPVRAHIQLGGPIVLVWDNLRMHLVEPMRQFIADHADWLTVFQLPSYSTDLNPQERRLGVGQARHRQPHRGRPRPGHPRRQAQAQADPVPP